MICWGEPPPRWLPSGRPSTAGRQFWEIAIYLVIAALAGRTKIRMTQRRSAEDHGSMSLGYVLTFTAMLQFGPAAALLVGAVGILSQCLYPKRQQAHPASL